MRPQRPRARQSRPWAVMVLLAAVASPPPAPAQRPDPFNERYYQTPPGLSPGPAGGGYDAADLTAQLALEARRLADDVQYELAGTTLGYQAGAQASALGQAVDRCRQLADRPGPGSSRFRSAVLQVEPALDALRATLQGNRGEAPSARRGLYRIGRLYGDLLRVAGLDNGQGPGPPQGPGSDRGRGARRLAQQLADDVTETQLLLQSSGLANYHPYNRVARDLISLGATVQEVVGLIDRREDPGAVLNELRGAQARADRIDGVLRNDPNLPSNVGQWWGEVLRDLSGLTAAVAGGAEPARPPVFPPPIIQPPVVIPPIIQPPPVVPPLPPAYGGPLAALDQWLGELDQLVAVQQSMVATAPDGFAILNEAKRLRSGVARLRQRVAAGAPPPGFQGAFREVERDYGRLRQRVDRVAGGRSGPNINLVRSMAKHLETIRAYSFP